MVALENAHKNVVAIINKNTNCFDIIKSEALKNNIKNIIEFSADEAEVIDANTFVYSGIEFKHNLIGKFNISNVVAALKVAKHYGVDLADCASDLKNFVPSKNRMQILNVGAAVVINDTYNSNPKALEEMLVYLDSVKQKTKIVVIGDMLELGQQSEFFHKQIADTINSLSLDYVYTIGQYSKCIYDNIASDNKAHFDDKKQLTDSIKAMLEKQCGNESVVLIKASRGCALDTVPRDIRDI